MLLGKTEMYLLFSMAYFNYLELHFYCERIKIVGMACDLKIYRAMFDSFYNKCSGFSNWHPSDLNSAGTN